MAAALAATGCATGDAPVLAPSVSQAVQIVPGPGLPVEYRDVAGPSNNNLDVVRHEDRVYLALRTAPDHFASGDAYLLVLSSLDQESWTFEARFHLGVDLREPRLLSFGGRLFLYFAKLGTNAGSFDPQGMLVSERLGPGQWSDPEAFFRADDGKGEGFIPWRVKARSGRAYMTAYRGGEGLYSFVGSPFETPIEVFFLQSSDGLAWAPVDPAHPIVLSGGASEVDFDFDGSGDLYAVARSELGDEMGWGSKVCHAFRAALGRWTCSHDPRKYDSPLVLFRDGAVLLVARRTVDNDGNYELSPGVPWSMEETTRNQLPYSLSTKRCALWQVDRASLTVRHVVDVPGWGDTCFPSVIAVPTDANALDLYNYSSPLDGPDLTWLMGQRGETRIYRARLSWSTR